jgi:hypothetical protein
MLKGRCENDAKDYVPDSHFQHRFLRYFDSTPQAHTTGSCGALLGNGFPGERAVKRTPIGLEIGKDLGDPLFVGCA